MHAKRRAQVITGTGGKDKAIALGMVERDGDRKHELRGRVRENVQGGFRVVPAMPWKSYDGLSAEYQHAVIRPRHLNTFAGNVPWRGGQAIVPRRD
jgi:hypothetical protein